MTTILVRLSLTVSILAFWFSVGAQIGHQTLTFFDASRNNRAIATEVYYPANVAGDGVPVAAGSFPVLVFGHGFVMATSAYKNIWEAFVAEGYIVCLPNTETGFSPVHSEFAKDLAEICRAMETENARSASLFFEKIHPKFAVMGHSMGGGAAILAGQYNDRITCFATLAAANTNPSAVAAAALLDKPALFLAGTADCITPPAAHAKAMYDAVSGSVCKAYVAIPGASHCQFANTNTNCELGELLSGCANPPLSRADQQAATIRLLLPWLDHFLKENQSSSQEFLTELEEIPAANRAISCTFTSATATFFEKKSIKISPQPLRDSRTVRLELGQDFLEEKIRCTLRNGLGQIVWSGEVFVEAGKAEIFLSSPLSGGLFFLELFDKNGISLTMIKLIR